MNEWLKPIEPSCKHGWVPDGSCFRCRQCKEKVDAGYGYTQRCALLEGHSAAHTIQVEHRKHGHAGGWCLSTYPDCPGDDRPCEHAWNEAVIESTGSGVVCRKCGVEGAVYL